MKPLVEKANPLKELQNYGQSVWLDYIRKSLISSGELARMIDQDGLRGMTSNPAIFEKAISGSADYADEIAQSQRQNIKDAYSVYEKLAVSDIQAAADLLKPVYEKSKARDGYVSLEVSPLLASDTQKTLDEARRLWKTVGRENLMIKVPATKEGLPAVKQLISEGINVNITLLFAQSVYEQVAEAYIAGLEALAAKGGQINKIGSVASFFVSRIDSAVDKQLSEKLKAAKNDDERKVLQDLLGKTAIANAKMAYQHYLKVFFDARWKALEAKGAQTQRLLWASTSTKNPQYRDVMYVEELIGEDTVNTIPPSTFDAFRDHGQLRKSLTEDVEGAKKTLETLKQVGISLDKVTTDLVNEGVVLFVEPFNKLLDTLKKQMSAGQHPVIDRMSFKLPADLDSALKTAIKDWHDADKVRRLWADDATLWTGQDEAKWLAWLTITDQQMGQVDNFAKLSQEIKGNDFTHALLLGMGGSSLCPEVLSVTFGKINGYPELHILDSTDPAQIKSVEKRIDLAKTIFIVSSKSGTTLEPNIYKQYFFDRVVNVCGKERAADQFIAITDPNSQMQSVAEREKFRHVFFGVPGIGGRYSALSNFGMVPAAVMGLDVKRFLESTEEMVHACSYTVPLEENPGLILGLIMGTAAKSGRDKVTLIASPAIYDLGAWLEQLLAESTGKEGKGLIPVDREELGAPDAYGKDRIFAYLRFDAAPDDKQDAAVERLEQAGHPVVRISVPDTYALGQEFFRWEFATAVAGSVIGINAFNQPDVEASKVATRELTSQFEKSGHLPDEEPIFEEGGIKLFTDKANADALKAQVAEQSLAGYLKAHLQRLSAGDYFALLAYVEMNDAHEKVLQRLRMAVRDKKKVATCLGFGPRFLHSTGQAYKGGPNSGVFLQITCDDAEDLPVPQQKYTFGVVKAAQARGDFQVLAERKRRALRVHLTKDIAGSLDKLQAALEKALT